MSGPIRKRTGFSVALVMMIFVLVCFAAAVVCVQFTGSKYQEAVASSALDFAELTIDADKAKESFITRIKPEDHDQIQNKLKKYQENNSSIIKRISLISYSNSAGGYIYDSGGASLGERIEYGDYTESVKAELINGRKTLRHYENGCLIIYRPIRTVDDTLCGFVVVELERPFEYRFLPYAAAFFGGLALLSIIFTLILQISLNRKLFRPLRKITETADYLTGGVTSSEEESDFSVMFDTNRRDEIGQLGAALQKVFFNMNSGAENLSRAIYDANHDGMTQHFNKRCYNSMKETFKKCDPICVIYFDVNNLKKAADYIRGFIGSTDYCFRMGGDEFLLVMTECTYRSADRIMEKLEKDEPYILSREEDSIKCSLSYGCAYESGEYSYDELLAEAEANMYEKKTELKKLLQMPDR